MELSNDRAEDIEELRERYDSLKTQKITAEANLKTSKDNLEKLKKEAKEKYGTDDLTSLRAKLEEMKTENKRRLAEYQEHLTGIERQLAEVETRHAQAASQESQA
jgi:hypothetical protein